MIMYILKYKNKPIESLTIVAEETHDCDNEDCCYESPDPIEMPTGAYEDQFNLLNMLRQHTWKIHISTVRNNTITRTHIASWSTIGGTYETIHGRLNSLECDDLSGMKRILRDQEIVIEEVDVKTRRQTQQLQITTE